VAFPDDSSGLEAASRLRKGLSDVRSLFTIGTVLALAAWSCGGDKYGDGGGPMSMPTPAANGSSATTSIVTIVGQQGLLSFRPNPASLPTGTLVTWHNADTATHRIVMNDGSFDSGEIVPGSSSSVMRLGHAGGGYHCTIHPTKMFGSLVPTY
jgi:plastocyanin